MEAYRGLCQGLSFPGTQAQTLCGVQLGAQLIGNKLIALRVPDSALALRCIKCHGTLSWPLGLESKVAGQDCTAACMSLAAI